MLSVETNGSFMLNLKCESHTFSSARHAKHHRPTASAQNSKTRSFLVLTIVVFSLKSPVSSEKHSIFVTARIGKASRTSASDISPFFSGLSISIGCQYP